MIERIARFLERHCFDILLVAIVLGLCWNVKGRMDTMETQLTEVKASVHVHPEQIIEETEAAFQRHLDEQVAGF